MSSPVSMELQSKIAAWRFKAADGTLTLDEMREGIVFLRAGRVSAAASSAAKGKKKSSVAPAADDMLADLEGL